MFKKAGFTFIEILIALGVFSVGVLAVLNLLITNLNTIDQVQVKTFATFLAKEGMELAFHVRDTNLQRELPWNCLFSNTLYDAENLDFYTQATEDLDTFVCAGYMASGADTAVLQIQLDPKNYYMIHPTSLSDDFDTNRKNNLLYLFTGTMGGQELFWYSHSTKDIGGEPSFFARYLLFTGIQENKNTLPGNNILKLESHVLYKKGTMTGEIVLESFIGQQ